jgi:protein disulfide-isomerase A6
LSKFITEKSSVKPKVKGKLPSQVVYLDDKTFKEKVGKDQDVLVAFTAPWCGRMFFPQLCSADGLQLTPE